MDRQKKNIELKKAGVQLPKRVVSRQIIQEILPWMERDEIIVITGARQTGKSVLLFQLMYDYLLPKTANIHYFNLDIPRQSKLLETSDHLINLAKISKGKMYIFIDEVQRLREPGIFLKGIYDLHLPLKIFVSGSSALEIKSRVHEALTGRKALFHLSPFNLNELSEALFPNKSFAQVAHDEGCFKMVLEHLLTFGGYPAVALAKGEALKVKLLNEIYTSYLEKDVKNFLKVENQMAFRNLVKILSSQIGNLVNKDEISRSLGIHKNTLDNYLFYLEQTFLMDFVRPFYRNPRKELLKSPKVYFCDLGIRNFAIGSFGEFEYRPDKGAILENSVYLSLKERSGPAMSVHFWRTKAGAEVDFVVLKGLEPIPFEVKATKMKEARISKSLRSFIQTYQPHKAYCVTLSYRGSQRVEKTEVSFLMPEDLCESKL